MKGRLIRRFLATTLLLFLLVSMSCQHRDEDKRMEAARPAEEHISKIGLEKDGIGTDVQIKKTNLGPVPTCPWGDPATPEQEKDICFRKGEFGSYSKRGHQLLCDWEPCEGEGDEWRISGPKNPSYNCFAYADDYRIDSFLGDLDSEPECNKDSNNPNCGKCGNLRNELSDADCFYESHGWTISESFHRECNTRKMCLLGFKVTDRYQESRILPLHGFIEECDPDVSWGGWGSKLGSSYHIHHSMWDIMGSSYGGLIRCYEKPASGYNQDACRESYDPWQDPENIPPECICEEGSSLRELNPWVCKKMAEIPRVKAGIVDGVLCGLRCIGDKSGKCQWIILCQCYGKLWCYPRYIKTYRLPMAPFDLYRPGLRLVPREYGYSESNDFGAAVAVIGDVTGDDIDDLAVGVPGAHDDRGEVLILDSRDGSVVKRKRGPKPEGRFGLELPRLRGQLMAWDFN